MFAATALLLPLSALAASDSQTTTISVTLGSTISVSTSGTVAVNVLPTAGGVTSSASDTVSVATNNDSGYTLTLADSDATTDLVAGSETIGAHSGTQASPTALAANSWGYRIDGVGGFGAGATSAETNVSSSAYNWAGVPSTGSPITIKTTASSTAGDDTIVWYAIRANTGTASGAYSDVVTYTATTNI